MLTSDDSHARLALERLQAAATLNNGLDGAALRLVADRLAELSDQLGATLLATDPVGERIIGVALALHQDCCTAVRQNVRLDSAQVLLVSGAVAGPVGLLQAARTARSLGAKSVHVAVLGVDPPQLWGCDSVTSLWEIPAQVS